MINPVSSQSSVQMQPSISAKTQQSAAPQKPQQTEDSVQISAQAKAALAAHDVDHDGDSH